MLNFLFGGKQEKKSDEAYAGGLSRLWLGAIVSDLADGVLVYDEDFKVVIFNKAAEGIFQIKESVLLGKILSLDQASNPAMKFLIQVVFPSLAPKVSFLTEENVYPQIMDLRFGENYIRVTSNKITDESGKTLGFVKIIRDRTREVEMMKSKSDFLTIAAHQLRTPITAVSWAFGGLKKDLALSTESKDLVNTGDLAAQKLTGIVEDLLNAAKLESGKFDYAFQEGDLASMVQSLLSEAQAIATAYGVKIYYDPPLLKLPVMKFDPQKIGIVFSNLVDNAIKYNVPNGLVTVSIKQMSDAPYVVISVKDTGVGVPPEALKNLYTKFFRAENVKKFSTEGSGLGLYIVKNIVERHGGKIWAESEINRGTTFYFTLPTDPALIPQKEAIDEDY